MKYHWWQQLVKQKLTVREVKVQNSHNSWADADSLCWRNIGCATSTTGDVGPWTPGAECASTDLSTDMAVHTPVLTAIWHGTLATWLDVTMQTSRCQVNHTLCSNSDIIDGRGSRGIRHKTCFSRARRAKLSDVVHIVQCHGIALWVRSLGNARITDQIGDEHSMGRDDGPDMYAQGFASDGIASVFRSDLRCAFRCLGVEGACVPLPNPVLVRRTNMFFPLGGSPLACRSSCAWWVLLVMLNPTPAVLFVTGSVWFPVGFRMTMSRCRLSFFGLLECREVHADGSFNAVEDSPVRTRSTQ